MTSEAQEVMRVCFHPECSGGTFSDELALEFGVIFVCFACCPWSQQQRASLRQMRREEEEEEDDDESEEEDDDEEEEETDDEN